MILMTLGDDAGVEVVLVHAPGFATARTPSPTSNRVVASCRS